jgi:hypothetical protein
LVQISNGENLPYPSFPKRGTAKMAVVRATIAR